MKILYFAWMRTKIGEAAEDVPLPAGVTTVGQLIDGLKQRSSGHAAAFADLSVVRAAVNQNFVDFDAPVAENDEIAFFPPVTGG